MITRSVRQQSLLNAYWIPLNFQAAAILTIAVPAALLHIPGINHTTVLAILASTVAALSLLVPPVAGAISDQLRRRGGQRRPVVLFGAAINVVGLFWMSRALALDPFAIALLVAILGQSISLAGYQPLIPEVVARSEWGLASGYQGIASLVGSVAGLAVASVTDPATTFLWTAGVVIAGAALVVATPEGRWADGEHARVGNWCDFAVAFTSRFFTNFGLTLLMTFVLYFFHDVLKLGNPSAGTGFFGGVTLLGAVVSSLWMGQLSDRLSRKSIVAAAGVPMSVAILVFALVPNLHWLAAIALLFGLGYGAIVSTGWALAIETVPQLRDVARDLGIWGVAAGLPGMLAPAFGGWLLAQYTNPAAGYRALFITAALCFVMGSLVVMLVGRVNALRRGICLQCLASAIGYLYYWSAYRIRSWGGLPLQRGATLVILNHQHDLDATTMVVRLSLGGPWGMPIYAASSRRCFEPGFLGQRLSWLDAFLRRFNASRLFCMLGMLPIENELYARRISRIAWSLHNKHGDLLLREVFRDDVVRLFGPRAGEKSLTWLLRGRQYKFARETFVSLHAVLAPYRNQILEESRANIAVDLDRMERILRSGATLYLAPEGRYTTDGMLGRLRVALRRLAPCAQQIYLVGMSYDVFVGRRLSQLFRIVAPADPNDLATSLKAARPVTVSQLLAAWLARHAEQFTFNQALHAVQRHLEELPQDAFVDPDLRRNAQRLVRAALSGMVRLGTLVRHSDIFSLTSQRSHPQFPAVADMLAFQARFFSETVEALQRLAGAGQNIRARS